MLSNACKYAIRALIYLATRMNDGVKVSIRELSAEIDSPEPFTAKIMQSLSKQEIVSSVKGPNGGFYIDEKQAEIRMIEIVKAIDGMQLLTGCGLGLKSCSDTHPCPIHEEYSVVRDGMNYLLNKKTIHQLALELTAGHSKVKN